MYRVNEQPLRRLDEMDEQQAYSQWIERIEIGASPLVGRVET
jgi:hypothetical protein